MTYSMNESFADNVIGKEVSFDIQPYTRGTGTITKCTPRVVKDVKDFDHRGRVLVTYEVFDFDIIMIEGTSVGALIAGVPVRETVKSITGTTQRVTGVNYSNLHDAVFGPVEWVDNKCVHGAKRTIVIALCG